MFFVLFWVTPGLSLNVAQASLELLASKDLPCCYAWWHTCLISALRSRGSHLGQCKTMSQKSRTTMAKGNLERFYFSLHTTVHHCGKVEQGPGSWNGRRAMEEDHSLSRPSRLDNLLSYTTQGHWALCQSIKIYPRHAHRPI